MKGICLGNGWEQVSECATVSSSVGVAIYEFFALLWVAAFELDHNWDGQPTKPSRVLQFTRLHFVLDCQSFLKTMPCAFPFPCENGSSASDCRKRNGEKLELFSAEGVFLSRQQFSDCKIAECRHRLAGKQIVRFFGVCQKNKGQAQNGFLRAEMRTEQQKKANCTLFLLVSCTQGRKPDI